MAMSVVTGVSGIEALDVVEYGLWTDPKGTQDTDPRKARMLREVGFTGFTQSLFL